MHISYPSVYHTASIHYRTMPPALSIPNFTDDVSTMSSPISGPTDLLLLHVGAQFAAPFAAGIENLEPAVDPVSVDFMAPTWKQKVISPGHTVLEGYLKTVNRSELLCLGLHSARCCQIFNDRLAVKTERLLDGFKRTAIDRAGPGNR